VPRRRGVYLLLILDLHTGWSGQRHAPAALYPRRDDPCSHLSGGWVGLGAVLDTEARGTILRLCRGRTLAVQSVIRHRTDWKYFKTNRRKLQQCASRSIQRESSFLPISWNQIIIILIVQVNLIVCSIWRSMLTWIKRSKNHDTIKIKVLSFFWKVSSEFFWKVSSALGKFTCWKVFWHAITCTSQVLTQPVTYIKSMGSWSISV
jgi:hypothetical protein